MKLYASAIVFAFAVTIMLINACLLGAKTQRAAPVNIYQLK